MFLESWEKEVGPIEDDARYWPRLRPAGGELVRAVAKEGEDFSDLLVSGFARLRQTVHRLAQKNAIYASYLAAISGSRSCVWITQAYFAPNREFRDLLEDAARRGVDVRLIVPANTDIGLLAHASRHQYMKLLASGVRIFEYEGTVMHAKTAVVDGVWSTVGSSNLDYQSFIHNATRASSTTMTLAPPVDEGLDLQGEGNPEADARYRERATAFAKLGRASR